MAEYIKKIRTDKGDFQIDYNALANLPKQDTTLSIQGAIPDSKAVGDEIRFLKQNYIPEILTSEHYGDELPDAGNKGRIFFKKVNVNE